MMCYFCEIVMILISRSRQISVDRKIDTCLLVSHSLKSEVIVIISFVI